MVCFFPFEIPPFFFQIIKAYLYFGYGCAVAVSIYHRRRKEWILMYLGLASSLGLDRIQSPLCNDRTTCTGKGCDRCSQPHPAQSYSCNTPRCPNRNVFCKPQDLLTIPLHIYLPVSETLKYNMDSILPGFLVVPYEKYNLISSFLSMFCIYFCFLEKKIHMVICITSKKIKALCV